MREADVRRMIEAWRTAASTAPPSLAFSDDLQELSHQIAMWRTGYQRGLLDCARALEFSIGPGGIARAR